MSAAADQPRRAASVAGGGEADAPSGDDPLGDLRMLLDPLEPSAAPASLTSTTIEMAAVTSGGGPGSPTGHASPRSPGLIVPVAGVLVSLVLGLVLGRATTSDPDEAILQYLPVVQHLEILREAGSIGFLETVAERQYTPPRRFPFGMGRGPGARPAEAGSPRPDGSAGESDDPWPQLEETVTALREGRPFGRETPTAILAARREEVEDLDEGSLRRLADAAAEFESLPRAVRDDLIKLARALSDGDEELVERLRAPARVWHQWLAWRDPADRRAVMTLGQDDRLEWLDRYTRAAMPPGRGFPGGGPFQPDDGRGERGGGRWPRPPVDRGDRRGGPDRRDSPGPPGGANDPVAPGSVGDETGNLP